MALFIIISCFPKLHLCLYGLPEDRINPDATLSKDTQNFMGVGGTSNLSGPLLQTPPSKAVCSEPCHVLEGDSGQRGRCG